MAACGRAHANRVGLTGMHVLSVAGAGSALSVPMVAAALQHQGLQASALHAAAPLAVALQHLCAVARRGAPELVKAAPAALSQWGTAVLGATLSALVVLRGATTSTVGHYVTYHLIPPEVNRPGTQWRVLLSDSAQVRGGRVLLCQDGCRVGRQRGDATQCRHASSLHFVQPAFLTNAVKQNSTHDERAVALIDMAK